MESRQQSMSAAVLMANMQQVAQLPMERALSRLLDGESHEQMVMQLAGLRPISYSVGSLLCWVLAIWQAVLSVISFV